MASAPASALSVAVGSSNWQKTDAVKARFEAFVAANFEPTVPVVVQGIKVESGVSSQPHGMDETLQGAVNRMRRAALACGAANVEADEVTSEPAASGSFAASGANSSHAYYVGMENGLVDLQTSLREPSLLPGPYWVDLCIVTIARGDLLPRFEVSVGTSVHVPILRMPRPDPSHEDQAASEAFAKNEADYKAFIMPFCQHDGADLIREVTSSCVGRTQALELACGSALGTLSHQART